MVLVKFTYALKRFFPKLADTKVDGKTISAILQEIEARHPGVTKYVLDDQGRLRQHVNIFIDGVMIKDRTKLTDPFLENSEIYIMQALSGG
ncbi:molybdenum cofactor biosynthesis protein MoaD [Niastella yeongjuensis]|uniref:Molybdenum cofactor biosynthesis protein MoaD n=1 Tax=Niastella yeongjuensis TaxID=354355 RepID=A0A1V9DYG3_9BACT|nr:MoaD/ThiS family protein [Niastella yeongjuensis]OQP38880.1 molybdenum cofactor biosynthesis protein MoaD [Niastella yeongjuensis]SEO29247.1 molybdopterin synthase subunit MoaD [Niastella yeongjuensis]